MSTPIGRYELVALDCSDHAGLAAFYHSIVGGEIDDGHPFCLVRMTSKTITA